MHLFITLLAAFLPQFGMIGVGYVVKRLRILHVTDADVLNRFVLDIALPAFIINALLSNKLHAAYIKLPVVMWVAMGGAFLATFLITKALKYRPKQVGACLLLATFPNTGFLGYPMTVALHPNLLPATVILDQFGMTFALYPSAILIGSIYGRTEGQTPKQGLIRFLKSPLFAAAVGGVILRMIPWPSMPSSGLLREGYVAAAALAGAMKQIIGLFAGATIPVVLVAIGILLRPAAVKEHVRTVAIVGVMRLVLCPLLGFLTARYILQIHDPALLSVIVLICGMPPAATATVFSGQYDMDGSLAVAVFFALTFLSALTVPLMLSVLH